MTIQDIDNGAKALVKKMGIPMSVKVGVMGSKAGEDHEGATVGEIASYHGFGIGVARRAWLADYVDENTNHIEEQIERIARGVLSGKIMEAQAMDLLGLTIQGEIQQRISSGIGKALDQKTIDRKGSNVQLIDTSQFRSSITYEAE